MRLITRSQHVMQQSPISQALVDDGVYSMKLNNVMLDYNQLSLTEGSYTYQLLAVQPASF